MPLGGVYLLERGGRGTKTRAGTLPPSEAVLALIRHSVTPRLAHAAGLSPRRLDFFARLAERVPVMRLRYPAGWRALPGICRAIERDAARRR